MNSRVRGLRVWFYKIMYNPATWAATRRLRRLYLHFWRVDAVRQWAHYGWRQSPQNYAAPNDCFSVASVSSLLSACWDTAKPRPLGTEREITRTGQGTARTAHRPNDWRRWRTDSSRKATRSQRPDCWSHARQATRRRSTVRCSCSALPARCSLRSTVGGEPGPSATETPPRACSSRTGLAARRGARRRWPGLSCSAATWTRQNACWRGGWRRKPVAEEEVDRLGSAAAPDAEAARRRQGRVSASSGDRADPALGVWPARTGPADGWLWLWKEDVAATT